MRLYPWQHKLFSVKQWFKATTCELFQNLYLFPRWGLYNTVSLKKEILSYYAGSFLCFQLLICIKIWLKIHQFFPNITLLWNYSLYSPKCCCVLVLQKPSSHMESPHPGIRRADSLFSSIYLTDCALVKGCFSHYK